MTEDDMAGMKSVDRLRDGGLAAKATSGVSVALDECWFPPRGHALWHPRGEYAPREEMVTDIMDRFRSKRRPVEKPVKVRDDGIVDGRRRLTVVNGSQRIINGLEAQRRLIADGHAPDGFRIYVDVEFFTGDDDALLLERLGSQDDRLQLPDCASVLSATVLQLRVLNVNDDDIAARMPRHASKADIEPLTRFDNLVPEARTAFDGGLDGVPVPLGLLSAVLDAPREKQMEALRSLLAAGVKTKAGATRTVNRNRRSAARASGETKQPQRPHPKAMRKALAACTGAHPLVDGDDRVDSGWDETTTRARVDGFVFALRYALGEIGVGDLPDDLREAVMGSVDDGGDGEDHV